MHTVDIWSFTISNRVDHAFPIPNCNFVCVGTPFTISVLEIKLVTSVIDGTSPF